MTVSNFTKAANHYGIDYKVVRGKMLVLNHFNARWDDVTNMTELEFHLYIHPNDVHLKLAPAF